MGVENIKAGHFTEFSRSLAVKRRKGKTLWFFISNNAFRNISIPICVRIASMAWLFGTFPLCFSVYLIDPNCAWWIKANISSGYVHFTWVYLIPTLTCLDWTSPDPFILWLDTWPASYCGLTGYFPHPFKYLWSYWELPNQHYKSTLSRGKVY